MFTLPKFVEELLQTFRKNTYEIYIVGGAVRNLLLRQEIKNWDFATNATPEQMLQLFPDAYYNNTYGTVTIPHKTADETFLLEVTTYRKESDYDDTRHPSTVEWSTSLEEDLSRRDLTINAMAYDGEKITDPFHGQEDFKKKVVVTVGDPDKRFNEDALRLLRAVRFASQLDFTIEEATRESIKKNAYLITKISWERIRDEFLKILASDHPAEGVLFLRNTELLKYILPEVDICFSVQQKSPMRHHVYDVGTHLMMSLKNCHSKDVITRFATLLHDIGKAKTFRKDEKTELITFYNHEVVGTFQTEEIANRFKLSNKEKDKLIRLVKYHQFTVSELQTDKAIRRFIREVGKENLEDMLALRTADRLGSGAKETSWRTDLFKKRLIEVQYEPFSIKDLKIDGKDVMEILNIKPGPQVGEILKSIFHDVDEGTLKNERGLLLEKVKSFRR